MREHGQAPRIGPFITISRQYGCGGFALGLLLLDILNENSDGGKTWKIYHKEILHSLATETNMASDLLEKQRRQKPQFMMDLFNFFASQRVPSGMEIRNSITTIIRGLAINGGAIIIGQGGSAVTADLPNGLSVRLEAPLDWRIGSVAFREGVAARAAEEKIELMEKEREFLRNLYGKKYPRKPAYNLIYDASVFSLAQIAQHVAYALKLMKLV
ncbi:MAG: cytidylate kinase family protein [Planctomycetes bacterium]|nr:cytidylate kinase family protein [Planctomycetota bacterium]